MSAACWRALALRSGSGWAAALAAADGRRIASVESARHISQLTKANGKRAFLVDTLALVRRLEAQGVPTKHAEAITSAMTEVLHDSIDNVAQSVVSKSEMQRSEVIQESNISKFKSEVQSSQGHHFSLLQRETEKLKGDIENMRSELRHEIDKVTAGQRLDLNLERGRIRDELAKQNSETTDLTNKLDREIHTLRAQLEAAKYDVIKYCIGTLVSISAVGLAMIRVLILVGLCGAVVISVNYRGSSEHRCPCAEDDDWAALNWASKES